MSKQTKRNSRYYGKRGAYARRGRINPARFIPFVAFLIAFVVSASLLIDYAVHSAKRKKENAGIVEAYEDAFIAETNAPTASATVEPVAQATAVPTTQPTVQPQPQILSSYRNLSGDIPARAWELYQQNNDLVGWLYIKGVVSLPVVYRDNEFYLNHNFEQQEDDGGTLFLDQYHPMQEDTQNLLIHGHNMYDNSMFGIVRNYNKLDNVKGHSFARFSTMYGWEDYVICAVLRVNPDPNHEKYFPYVGKAKFSNAAAFNDYANALKQRSLFHIPVDLKPSDAMLSLSTCVDDERLLVVFRRIRAGETTDILQEMVNQSYWQ